MYFDSRLVCPNMRDGSPCESDSHHRLEGRPRELPLSWLSLTLMLRMGDSDGI